MQSEPDIQTSPPPDPAARAAVTIRAARVEDAPALNAVANQPGFRRQTLRLPFRPVAETRKWLEGQGETDTILVAEVAGQVVGMADLARRKGRMAHSGGIGMGLHDDWCGRGIGSALMRELLDIADSWLGLQRVDLTVYADNAPAIALYRKFGFVEEGRHRAFALRDGVFVDALTMARLRGL